MSNYFKASNGIELDEYGYVDTFRKKGISVTNTELHEARKEFYQSLRDKELGRWRSKKNPDFVVYSQGEGNPVLIFDELTGKSWSVCPEEYSDADTIANAQVAKEWLEENKTSQPWEQAKPGEMWELTDDEGNTYMGLAVQVKPETELFFVMPDGEEKYLHEIADGKRVWSGEENETV